MKNVSNERLSKLQHGMYVAKNALYLVSNAEDLYYLTGKVFSRGYALISFKEAFLIVDGRYFETAKEIEGWSTVSLEEKALKKFFLKMTDAIIHFSAQDLTVEQLQSLKKASRGCSIRWKVGENIVSKERMIKDEKEIRLIKKSAAITLKSVQHAKEKIREGMREIDLARMIHQNVLEFGGEKLSFEPIIAFGTNTSMPHYRSGEKKLKQGEIVLMDVGSYSSRYASDMTRMFYFGKMPNEVKRLDRILMEAVQIAIDLCRPGEKIIHLDQAVRNHFKKYGVEKNFVHSLGHGIGLDVHEFPRVNSSCKKQVLEEGMVITIEPGLYFPKKYGFRHEEMVLITKKGHQVITKE